MFADEGITTEEEDINEYLGAEAVSKAKKLTEQEREEMDKDITLENIEDTIKKPEKRQITRCNRVYK